MHFVRPKKLDVLDAFPPGNRTVVTLRDNLDSVGASALRERLIDVLHRGTDLLILDLSQVRSCDPVGLAVLVATQRRAGLLGIGMRLVAPSPAVSKVLTATGLKRHFAISSEIGDLRVAAVRAMVLGMVLDGAVSVNFRARVTAPANSDSGRPDSRPFRARTGGRVIPGMHARGSR